MYRNEFDNLTDKLFFKLIVCVVCVCKNGAFFERGLPEFLEYSVGVYD